MLRTTLVLIAMMAPAPKNVSPSDQVSIDAGFAVAEGQLEITYTVENRRSGDIWILDIEETTSPPHYVPRSPRVELESPETAVLACWWEYQPPPPGTAWVTPPVFYGTRVAAGQKHSATMRVRLPLVAAGAGRGVECTLTRFEVAAILEGPGVQAVGITGRSLGRFYLEAMATQKALSARARPVRVPLVFGGWRTDGLKAGLAADPPLPGAAFGSTPRNAA